MADMTTAPTRPTATELLTHAASRLLVLEGLPPASVTLRVHYGPEVTVQFGQDEWENLTSAVDILAAHLGGGWPVRDIVHNGTSRQYSRTGTVDGITWEAVAVANVVQVSS
jgi:hypothetical protein